MTDTGADSSIQRARRSVRAFAGLAAAVAFLTPVAAGAQVFGSWGYRTWGWPVEVYGAPPSAMDRRAALRSYEPDFLTRAEIRDILAYEGFRLTGLVRRDDVFIAQVTDRSGQNGRMVMDALDGTILEHVTTSPVRRSPREVRSGPPEAGMGRDSAARPRVTPGIGPVVMDQKARPKVAVAREPKPAPPKAAPGKSPPSRSMTTPKAPMGEPKKNPEIVAPPQKAAVAPSSPLVAIPEPPAPLDIEAVTAPGAKDLTQNPAGLANGVPVNPLE